MIAYQKAIRRIKDPLLSKDSLPNITIQVPKDRLSKAEYVTLPDYEKEHYVKNLIKSAIELNYPNGVTAKQLRDALDIDARAVDKHLTSMTRTGEIYTVQYDRTTVYLPNTRALHAVLEQTFKINENEEFHLYQLRNRLGDFIYIQERKKRGHVEDIGSGIQLPVGKFSDFLSYLKKAEIEMMKRT